MYRQTSPAAAKAAILTSGERVDEGRVRGRRLRGLLLWLRYLRVALGELQAKRLRKIGVEPNALLANIARIKVELCQCYSSKRLHGSKDCTLLVYI